MRREVLVAMTLGVATAGAAHGQHAIGVSAEIRDAVEAAPVELRLQGGPGGLQVVPEPRRGGSMLLEQVRVARPAMSREVEVPVEGSGGQAAPPPAPGGAGPAERVTITRVIAVNA